METRPMEVPALMPPIGFEKCLEDIAEAQVGVEGWLSRRESDFLAMLAACPTCEGTIMEIGSYRGKSAIAMAKAAALADGATIHTVDTSPPVTLEKNLRRAGVREKVRVYQMTSGEMLSGWPRSRRVRVAFHDGSAQHEIVSADVEQCIQFLADGAILACHDVLNTSGDRIHVFIEQILRNEHFGAAGACGSIGWAQYRSNPADCHAFYLPKERLVCQLERLRPFRECVPLSWPQRVHYRLLRARVPHDFVRPEAWLRQVA
jgi:predicted O-methyltransferase YrrM